LGLRTAAGMNPTKPVLLVALAVTAFGRVVPRDAQAGQLVGDDRAFQQVVVARPAA
jgi:hypothetical protein